MNKYKVDYRKQQIELSEEIRLGIENLKKSLVFAMSKGSHELFHTNIWAWLIERNKKFCKVFFPKIEGEFVEVTREEGYRDLTIWVKVRDERKAFVVENKFKSLPRSEQLKDYEMKLGDSFASGLLVAAQKPQNFDVENWNVYTQDEVLCQIENILHSDDAGISDAEKKIVQEYMAVTRHLTKVLTYFSSTLGDQWPFYGTVGLLEDVKLGDILQKMKASEFVTYIRRQPEITEWNKKLEEINCLNFDKENAKLEIEIESGYSHKQALVDFRIIKRVYEDRGWKEVAGIGVQLQGIAYNRCVYTFDRGKGVNWLDQKFSENWLECNDFLIPDRALNRRICGYKTSDYVFRYRGIALESYTYKALYERMCIEMRVMLELLENGSLNELFN